MMSPDSFFKFKPFRDEYDFQALEESYLWASKLSELNDPMEAFLRFDTNRDLSALNRLANAKAFLLRAQHIVSDIAPSLSVVCFSTNLSSKSMWGYYANGFKGACLEYDATELLRSSANGTYKPEKVIYSTRPIPDFAFNNFQEPSEWHKNYKARLHLKHTDWQHENEWRIVCGQNGKLPISNSALKNVYLGPLMKSETATRIFDIIKTRPTSIFKMEVDENNLRSVQIK